MVRSPGGDPSREHSTTFSSSNEMRDKLRAILLERMIKGEKPEDLLDNLKRKLDESDSLALLSEVSREYNLIKERGDLEEREMNAYFSKKKMTKKERLGALLLAIGSISTLISYISAAHLGSYTIFVGAMIAGMVLIFM